jgi:hypothetical protein
MVEEIALRNEITPAVMFGGLIEPLTFAISLILFPISFIGLSIRRLKARRS